MGTMRRVCVYCGSSAMVARRHHDAASRLGSLLAQAGIGLVYGGGRAGLMGLLANATLAAGGEVIGVIPRHLVDAEVAHAGLDQLIVVGSMHERKQRMFELADAFVTLPGGFGTLDETIEVITWRLLGLHDKPILIVEGEGYWAPLRRLFDHVIAEGFAGARVRDCYGFVPSVEDVLATLARLPPPSTETQSKLV